MSRSSAEEGGRRVRLRGRGTTFVHEMPGPPGAPVLVLLHGWMATAALNWFLCLPALDREFRVLALDQRGHGRGIRSSRPFRLEDCADDVVALADALAIERVIPVGYSMGGSVAQLVWRRHPDRVDGMVLCATSQGFGDPDRPLLGAAGPLVTGATRMLPLAVRRRMAEAVLGRPDDDSPLGRWIRSEVEGHDPAALMEAGMSLNRFSSHAWTGSIDVPVAVVVTLQDRLVAARHQLDLAHAIPGATVHHVQGGHDSCVARPAAFVPALVDACRSVARRARAPRAAHAAH